MTPPRTIAACLLLISVIVTSMLVFQHFTGAAIYGCAPDSACAQAAGSVWGRVPGTSIPVSFAGLAYYLAMLVVFLIHRGNVGSLIWIVRLGVAASLMFIGVMLANMSEYMCIYCLIGHLTHLVFWGVVEFGNRATARDATPAADGSAFVLWIAGFIIIAAGLVTVDVVQQRYLTRTAEGELAETERQLAEGGQVDRGFVGRYVRGRPDAPIQVVVFTGYQCPDCKRFEEAFEQVFAERDDVAFSVKHYPLNNSCNRYIMGAMHPNACSAAYAAEAAGSVGGSEGFWKMHDWIFEKGGAFTTAELRQAVRSFGLNERQFFDLYGGLDIRKLVMADVDEAQSVGVLGTPLIFINGVELRGWHLPDALPRAIAAASQRGIPPEEIQRPSAYDKYMDDWRLSRSVELGPTTEARAIGAAEPRVRVEIWGDHLTASTAEFDAALRKIMAERNDIRYTMRSFPLDQRCNPGLGQTQSPLGCIAALAAEAAARLQGESGYAALHEWLIANHSQFTIDALRHFVESAGFDPAEFSREMQNPETEAAVLRDIAEAHRLRIRQVPMIFVNDKYLPRWRLEGHDVLRDVIEEAAQQ